MFVFAISARAFNIAEASCAGAGAGAGACCGFNGMKSFGGVPSGVVDAIAKYGKLIRILEMKNYQKMMLLYAGVLTDSIGRIQFLLEAGKHGSRESVSTLPDIDEFLNLLLSRKAHVSLHPVHEKSGKAACMKRHHLVERGE